MHSILAVDDSISSRHMARFTLKITGYDVVEAVDGEDALDKARQRGFDLILTTGSSDQMRQAGRAAGATGWLVKPYDPVRPSEVIRKVVR